MDSSSQLSVDYFDSQISTLTEPMFPPTSDISSVPPTSTVASSSLSSSSEAPPMPSSPADVDFRSVASVIEKARRAVAMAAPFIVADESGEVAALLEAFLEKAPVFRDAGGDVPRGRS
ncbi:hypothetical protein QR680_012461 [Steinernema hermaphroditum]|uniref:Uncharacterized protein n=1 Tax=Steinernema hermaphroditum TaxID=289476 RepID=A0AA39I4M8_9BILA|nr:hypothetical protein QR680_012461 [Steinernema hermaphroditum]